MRRTKENALITKENLLDTALEIFNLKGYSQTTLDDIASGAHLSRGALYFHFKDKDDLFKQLLSREMAFISDLLADCFVSDGNEKQQLQTLLFNVVENFYSNKRFRNVIQLTWFSTEVIQGSASLIDKTNLNEFFMEEVETILIRAQKKGMIEKSINPLTLAIQFTIQINGMYRLFFVTPKYMKSKSHIQKIMQSNIDQVFLKPTT